MERDFDGAAAAVLPLPWKGADSATGLEVRTGGREDVLAIFFESANRLSGCRRTQGSIN
jgi:hypothetical protein